MSDLHPPLRRILRDPLDHAHLERMRRRIAGERRARMPRDAPRWSAVLWTGAGVAAATLLLSFALFASGADDTAGPLRLLEGAAIGPLQTNSEGAARVVGFNDGSAVRLYPGTRLEPRHNTETELMVALPRGAVDVHVRPGGPRRWRVVVDDVTVAVVGTSFRVARQTDDVTISVLEGRVRVSGPRVPGGDVSLGQGEQLTVPLTDPPAAPAPTTPADSAAPVSSATVVHTDLPEPAVDRLHAGPPVWRGLVAERRYDEAFEALGSTGLEGRARSAADVDELLALSDVARLSGHPSVAVPALRRIVRDFPSDRRAGIAAFTLGRVQLDSLGNASDAARSFARAMDLGLPTTLVDDALARRAEAQWHAGDRAGARTTAERYLLQYPGGLQADRVRQWAGTDEPGE